MMNMIEFKNWDYSKKEFDFTSNQNNKEVSY